MMIGKGRRAQRRALIRLNGLVDGLETGLRQRPESDLTGGGYIKAEEREIHREGFADGKRLGEAARGGGA